jgi:prepilin-type N-terminal cleavage/methylation domain-containing protein
MARKNMKTKGFTLVELMIVVSILGILSALAFPSFQDHITLSRENAAKSTLQVFRAQIELYKYQHDGLAPGYINTTQAPYSIFTYQFIGTSSVIGMASSSKIPNATYCYGPYLMALPANPFNDQTSIIYVPYSTGTSADFEPYLTATNLENTGWLYQKETATIKLCRSGNDSQNTSFLEY